MPHFIDEACINCASCEPVCPVPCITGEHNAHIIDGNMCIDCGSCTEVCPVDAIHIR